MSLDLGLHGKVAIVTGGSVGIGKETAGKLAAEGVLVVIAARTLSTLEKAAEQLRAQTKGSVTPIAVDTTNSESVRELVAATARQFGSVDILVNCAAAPGGLVRNNIELAEEEALLLDLNTKLVGYFRTCKACVPHMRAAKWGRIVNVGADSSLYRGPERHAQYGVGAFDEDALGSTGSRWNHGKHCSSGCNPDRARAVLVCRDGTI